MAMIPNNTQPVIDGSGRATVPWRQWFNSLSEAQKGSATSADVQAQITELATKLGSPDGTIAGIPADAEPDALILGQASIRHFGSLKDGRVFLQLEADENAPLPTYYYGTDSLGVKGWHPVAETITATANITLTVDPVTGVTTIDLADLANAGGGTLQKTLRDAKGRLSGTSAATTTDLAEGSNLYHTAARVLATVLAGLSTATNAAITATDSVLVAFGKAQAQINGLLTSKADKSITISTTAPLTGGGDLSANRTLAISAATTADPGSMSAADKSKLDGITGTNTGDQTITLTSDVTGSGTGSFAATVAANAVTNAKLADVPTATLKGRITAATGDPEDLTAAQARTVLNVADGATANATDAQLRDRATHTGTQLAATVSDFTAAARAAAVADVITDGVIDVAPSQNAVFDALALKAPLASPSFTGEVNVAAGGRIIVGGALGIGTSPLQVSGQIITKGPFIETDASTNSVFFALRNTITGGRGWSFFSSGGGPAPVGTFGIYDEGVAITRFLIGLLGELLPGGDNTQTIGKADTRWKEIFCVNATINTSDARDKSSARTLTPPELAAAKELAQSSRMYQWKDAVAKKGSAAARWHFTPEAQTVIAIMQKHGLDAFRYGFVCHDSWDALPAMLDPDTGKEVQPARPAGDRYGLRPTQLANFVAAGMASRLDELERLVAAKLP